ncbi:MAG: hypothetical protein ACPIOQ_62875, partial [Promethearchaeia archaeon]
MLIGNMMVNGFFCGDAAASMVQKLIMGLFSALIMLPVTIFFKWIFMTLDVDPKTRARWEMETARKAARKKQELAMTITTGPNQDGIAAPPPHLRGVVPPNKIVRGYVPNPDHARMGVASRIGTFATRFKRRWTSNQAPKMHDDGRASVDTRGSRSFTPNSAGGSSRAISQNSLRGHESSLRSVSSEQGGETQSRSSGSGEFDRRHEVGAYLPRRALPMRTSPRPPAPSVLSSRDEFSSVLSSHAPTPLHLKREMVDGPDEQKEFLHRAQVHSKKEVKTLRGRAKFEAKIARKLVAAISKPVDEKKDKRKKLIDYRF